LIPSDANLKTGDIIHSKLEEYVRRILDLSQRNKAIYFATSPDVFSDWKKKTVGFKILTQIFNKLCREEITLLSFSVVKNELRDTCIELDKANWEEVEKQLSKLYSRNREFMRDYGVNICYIVYGFLIWREGPNLGKGLYVKSPLLVAEANLERKRDRRRGQVSYQVSLSTPFRVNESLMEMLLQQYGINLMEGLAKEGVELEFEEPAELESILKRVEEAISEDTGWRVEREIWIAGLYFGNIEIYHDAKYLLNSGKLESSPIIRALCGEELVPPLTNATQPSDIEIDKIETPLPADRSQCEVIWYAERGLNLVVHGPPGTGKSQTIANLVARAVRDGRKVLFVAERREAIDVVYSRLEELGATLPVLRIFAVTNKERDQVLEQLYKTMGTIIRGDTQYNLLSGDGFPETEYEREREYFEILTRKGNEPTESKSLYELVGYLALKERELERWGLLNLTNKYHNRRVWKEYEKIHGLTLQTYWSKVVELLKLPLLPKMGELKVIPSLTSFLDEVKNRFGDIPCQDVVTLFQVLKELHPILTDGKRSEVLSYCLRFDEQTFEELHQTIKEVMHTIERLCNIEEELKNMPNYEDLLIFEKRLHHYDSWWKRAFSAGYTRLRRELMVWLKIDSHLPHQDVIAEIQQKKYWLESLRQQKQEEVQKLRDLIQHAKEKGYVNLIWPPSKRPLPLKIIYSITDKLLNLKKTFYSSKAIKLLNEDLEFFKSLSTRIPESDLDSIIGLLNRAPMPRDNELSLNSLLILVKEVQYKIQSIKGTSLRTVMDLVEQITNLPNLNGLIKELPEGIDFEQFRTMLEYLRFREHCEAIMERYGEKLDHELIENCRKTVKAFYEVKEKRVIAEFLSKWHERALSAVDAEMLGRLESVSDLEKYLERWERKGTLLRLQRLYNTLKKELSKKTKRISLRRLFYEYLSDILVVKPILMMSTAVVSAVLPRDFIKPFFDIVVFDEASQMKFETALPSIARGKQVVVIGDEHQMPPSRYFERLAFFREEDEEEEEEPLESLLQACLTTTSSFFKEVWLQWYYRGSHESLIAFSNEYFYKDDKRGRGGLIILPSPNPSDSRVEFVYVNCPRHPNGGCYIEGKGVNPCEAVLVVQKLLEELAKTDEDGLTVGVVAMNERQQEVIENLIEKVCQASDPESLMGLLDLGKEIQYQFIEREQIGPNITEELISKLERMLDEDKIWVRNLESVQGKEADYIILSMTYGKGKDGKLRQQFGPINREGGERRINVLISRAREKMIVVSSMRSSDLRISEETPKGVKVLRDFLRYVEEGGRLVEEREIGCLESPFEESVYKHLLDTLSDLNVEIIPQVGVGKYRIDLGIKKDGKYLLGIECDGALYHRHRAARERDRIREECLKRMGWEIYHVWSTAWFDGRSRFQILKEIKELIEDKLSR